MKMGRVKVKGVPTMSTYTCLSFPPPWALAGARPHRLAALPSSGLVWARQPEAIPRLGVWCVVLGARCGRVGVRVAVAFSGWLLGLFRLARLGAPASRCRAFRLFGGFGVVCALLSCPCPLSLSPPCWLRFSAFRLSPFPLFFVVFLFFLLFLFFAFFLFCFFLPFVSFSFCLFPSFFCSFLLVSCLFPSCCPVLWFVLVCLFCFVFLPALRLASLSVPVSLPWCACVHVRAVVCVPPGSDWRFMAGGARHWPRPLHDLLDSRSCLSTLVLYRCCSSARVACGCVVRGFAPAGPVFSPTSRWLWRLRSQRLAALGLSYPQNATGQGPCTVWVVGGSPAVAAEAEGHGRQHPVAFPCLGFGFVLLLRVFVPSLGWRGLGWSRILQHSLAHPGLSQPP